MAAGAKFCSECGESIRTPVTGDNVATEGIHENTEDGNTSFAAITHILALFTWVIGPIIVLVATKDDFVKENVRNALNWQIMFSVYMVLSVIFMIVLIGFVLVFIIAIFDFAFCIIAAIKASDGEAWKYPITIDFV